MGTSSTSGTNWMSSRRRMNRKNHDLEQIDFTRTSKHKFFVWQLERNLNHGQPSVVRSCYLWHQTCCLTAPRLHRPKLEFCERKKCDKKRVTCLAACRRHSGGLGLEAYDRGGKDLVRATYKARQRCRCDASVIFLFH